MLQRRPHDRPRANERADRVLKQPSSNWTSTARASAKTEHAHHADAKLESCRRALQWNHTRRRKGDKNETSASSTHHNREARRKRSHHATNRVVARGRHVPVRMEASTISNTTGVRDDHQQKPGADPGAGRSGPLAPMFRARAIVRCDL